MRHLYNLLPQWDKALNSLMFYKLHIELLLQYLKIMDNNVRIFRKYVVNKENCINLNTLTVARCPHCRALANGCKESCDT